jgi:hypothetical protein
MFHKLETIAQLLDSVRWGRDRASFRARCPAHGGGADTLSVRINPTDERLQLRCFAECGAVAVLSAIGLDLSALYPDREKTGNRTDNCMRKLPPLPYREALIGIDHEANVVLIAAGRLERGHPLSANDMARLVLSVERIEAARRIARA